MRGDIQTDEVLQDLNLALTAIMVTNGWEPLKYDLWSKLFHVVRCSVAAGYNRYIVHVRQPVSGGPSRAIYVWSPDDITSDELLAKIAEVSE